MRWLTTALAPLETVRFRVLGIGDQEDLQTTPLWHLSLEGLSLQRSARPNQDGCADVATAELTLMMVPEREALTSTYEFDEAIAQVEEALDDVSDADATTTHRLTVTGVASEWRIAEAGQDRSVPAAMIRVTCWVTREAGRTRTNHNP